MRIIPALLVAGFALVAFTAAPGDTSASEAIEPPVASAYSIDRAHSSVSFRVRHLGISNVTGTFSDYDADVQMVGDDLSTLTATASIKTGSIDTRNQRRDDHLRSDDFFASDTFPDMTFVSTGVRDVNGDSFKIEGDLTIRDVTLPVVLDAELIGATMGPDGTHRMGIEARTTIDRHDFGLTWDRLTEAGGVVVARNVQIVLDIQAIRQDG